MTTCVGLKLMDTHSHGCGCGCAAAAARLLRRRGGGRCGGALPPPTPDGYTHTRLWLRLRGCCGAAAAAAPSPLPLLRARPRCPRASIHILSCPLLPRPQSRPVFIFSSPSRRRLRTASPCFCLLVPPLCVPAPFRCLLVTPPPALWSPLACFLSLTLPLPQFPFPLERFLFVRTSPF
jgi:hypothetical protein